MWIINKNLCGNERKIELLANVILSIQFPFKRTIFSLNQNLYGFSVFQVSYGW